VTPGAPLGRPAGSAGPALVRDGGLSVPADPRAAVRAYLASIHAHSSEFP